MNIWTGRDKVTRMSNQSAQIEAGRVLLPVETSWLGDFQNEVLQFPDGRYDDQVDSMSQFLGWKHNPGPGVIVIPLKDPWSRDSLFEPF